MRYGWPTKAGGTPEVLMINWPTIRMVNVLDAVAPVPSFTLI